MNNVSLIYCTCDAYIDLSDNFFILLKKYWPEYSGDIYFNADSIEYHNGLFNIINIVHQQKKPSWSQRLYDCLKSVDTEYTMVFLDDYYLENRVNHQEFLRCLGYMDGHKNVASITFTKEPGTKKALIQELGNFSYRKHFSPYKITAHISIYRTRFLRSILRKNETAWEFEVNGSIRSLFRRGGFICKTDKNFTFPYHYGLLVSHGKYNKSLKEYFEKNENLSFPVERPYLGDEKDNRKSKIVYIIKGLLSLLSKKPI